jgi:hypothetical protein
MPMRKKKRIPAHILRFSMQEAITDLGFYETGLLIRGVFDEAKHK